MATKFNPNKIDEQELNLIHGIGPILANRIIAGRPFKDVEELAVKVDGISWDQAEEVFEIPQEEEIFEIPQEEGPHRDWFRKGLYAAAAVVLVVLGVLLGDWAAAPLMASNQDDSVPTVEKLDSAAHAPEEDVLEETSGGSEVAQVPADWGDWFGNQVFEDELCDPQTYVWWEEVDFEMDGANGDSYDMVIHGEQQAVLWGSKVVVDGIDYGKGLVVITEPGRYAVEILDGAYRVGIDSGSHFPQYWENVLSCLYEGDWTPQIH